jgi:hypothetical protein
MKKIAIASVVALMLVAAGTYAYRAYASQVQRKNEITFAQDEYVAKVAILKNSTAQMEKLGEIMKAAGGQSDIKKYEAWTCHLRHCPTAETAKLDSAYDDAEAAYQKTAQEALISIGAYKSAKESSESAHVKLLALEGKH